MDYKNKYIKYKKKYLHLKKNLVGGGKLKTQINPEIEKGLKVIKVKL